MRQVQLVLTESVQNLGETGDLVRVKPGYARNYLIPQGKAIPATDSRVKELEHNRRIMADRVAKQLVHLETSKTALEKLSLEVSARAGEEGRLFGSVTNAQVAGLLAEKGFEIDRRRIDTDPIKSVGEHTVRIKLHRDVVASLVLKVSAEGAPLTADPLDDIVDPDDVAEAAERAGDEDEDDADL
ncbi:MAG: 50S ribosomal protein L9 [Myxococcota bacterium]